MGVHLCAALKKSLEESGACCICSMALWGSERGFDPPTQGSPRQTLSAEFMSHQGEAVVGIKKQNPKLNSIAESVPFTPVASPVPWGRDLSSGVLGLGQGEEGPRLAVSSSS